MFIIASLSTSSTMHSSVASGGTAAAAAERERHARLSVNGFTRKYTPIGLSSAAALAPSPVSMRTSLPYSTSPSPRPNAAALVCEMFLLLFVAFILSVRCWVCIYVNACIVRGRTRAKPSVDA